eukprot:CAMPEP_0202909004 /NCGR_PEP_ID=MMETSP1392-20130828/47963_1 /ASSEMBLY_ACC=CAM_ASM_000868 /TAXON_ID=225041 /ORGANISM="Chlamydomonas chlamydogama, Strain SAG 11-48b" /LENGTH=119 /DNA_ID=CAMNT_0049598585 /DNA_START=758 /DNA_END=1118 /DNA_ORIENTATION=+
MTPPDLLLNPWLALRKACAATTRLHSASSRASDTAWGQLSAASLRGAGPKTAAADADAADLFPNLMSATTPVPVIPSAPAAAVVASSSLRSTGGSAGVDALAGVPALAGPLARCVDFLL